MRVPILPRINQVLEWQQHVRKAFGSASGRPSQAYKFICVAEKPGITMEDLQDSGDFESIDCKLAAALTEILNSELRQDIKLLENQEHKHGRMLKGRQIYWVILQSYKVTEAEDSIHDFERINALRMRDDDLARFLAEWDNLLLDLHEPPSTKILESLFRSQIQRHPWMKMDMAEYNRFPPSHPN